MASEYDASAPINLTLAQNYFAKTRKTGVFPGWGPSLSDRSPSKAYSVKFSARFDESFRSSPNLIDHPHRLNISATNYFARTRRTRFFTGSRPTPFDRSPARAYCVKFSRRFQRQLLSVASCRNLGHNCCNQCPISIAQVGFSLRKQQF